MEDLQDFTGTINLHPNDKRYQFLLASQNYGTLYAIYGKFDIENNADGNSYLNNLKLKILNYKGLVNIGFLENKVEPKYTVENNELTMELHVQGLTGLSNEDFLTNYKIDISDIKEMKLNRILHFLSSKKNDIVNGVFDNEFYYRDGVENDNDQRPNKDNRKHRKGLVKDYNDDVYGDFLINRNCHSSMLYVTKIDPENF